MRGRRNGHLGRMVTIDGKEVEMDERVWQQLLALPYSIEVDDEGHIVMTSLQEPALTFEELATTHPILPNDLYWKVETNAQNQLIMSPPPRLDHSDFESEIIALLLNLLPNGRVLPGPGVKTKNGTRIPDLVWVSVERRRQQRGQISFVQSPEICIEVLSPSNSRREIEEKKRLYLEAGALEVWTCGRDGAMKFFDAEGTVKSSKLCPEFPARINLLD